MQKKRGQHYCHASLNDILHRAFETAKMPERLEPTGLTRTETRWDDHGSLGVREICCLGCYML